MDHSGGCHCGNIHVRLAALEAAGRQSGANLHLLILSKPQPPHDPNARVEEDRIFIADGRYGLQPA